MIISITVPCANDTSHPITLDIVGWDNWTILDSPCVQQYGKMFGLMQPCAEYAKNKTSDTYEKIIKAIGAERNKIHQAIQILHEIATFATSNFVVKKAIKEMFRFGEDAIPSLHSLLTTYDIFKQSWAAETIKKLNQKKQIKIPPTTEYILKLMEASEQKNRLLIKNILHQIITDNIRDAAPTIFYYISDNSNIERKLYINAFLQIEPNALEIATQLLHTGTYLQQETAMLVLEAIDPPNLFDTAIQVINGFGVTEAIAARIIKAKAKETDIDRLLDIITQADYTLPVDSICETIIQICPTKAQNIFFEYFESIKNNPNMKDWKRRKIIKYISKSDKERYKQNPLQFLKDFDPDESEILEFLEGIQSNIHHSDKTKQRIIQKIKEELEENLPFRYDPTTIRYILERFP